MSPPWTIKHWLAAGTSAVCIHALALIVMPPTDKGADAAGSGGVQVAVSLAAARLGGEVGDASVPDEAKPVDEPVEAKPPPPELDAKFAAPEVTELPPPTNVTPVEAAPVVEHVEPVQDVKASRVVEMVAKPVQPRPRPTAKPKPPVQTAKLNPTANVVKPEQTTEIRPAVADTRFADETPAQTAVVPAAAPPDAAGSAKQEGREAGRTDTQATDVASAAGGGPVAAVSPDYTAQLRYWLERHKTYPKNARRRRMQGTVHLYFRVTRNGQVLVKEIRKSSGFSILDDEAEEMLRRAEPLPKFPKQMAGGYLDIVVPVSFSLRGNR